MATFWIDGNGIRFNPFARHIVNGVVYSGNILSFPSAMAALGVQEISEPAPPADYEEYLYYRTEQENAPYVVYTRKPQEQIDAFLIKRFEVALDSYLDTVAQVKHYDDRKSAALRAGYEGPFKAEGTAFAQWMDNCNVFAYTTLESVKNGTSPIPTVEDFLASLPDAPWPVPEA